MGELVSAIAMRPVTFFVLLTLAVLLLPCILILYEYQMMKKIKDNVKLEGYDALVHYVHNRTKVALILLIIMMVTMVISTFAFVTLIVRAARREVHLCAAYMKEMEKTAQSERKSMKKSMAFASANHDVRGYLSCIKGLIELCYSDLSSSSQVISNLKKVDTCADDLLALVNSILDFSKIEAGKMQLEEKKFDLAQLLEEIADLHHLVAIKKGVEVILDPCDGSTSKFSQVKGDCGKLKQILSNLLSNAVKFTSHGHISVKCHAKKPSLENSIIASNRNNFLNRMSCFFYKNNRAYDDLEEMKTIKKDPSCIEFEFEVEDTGPGIPREKRRSIFEDFVQVKETSTGQTGIGLGLGIVQSLVRLMGGDIEIVDKADGLQGTCFKFNIFLIVQEPTMSMDPKEEVSDQEDIGPSSRLRTCVHSIHNSCVKRSFVVLLIENDARRIMVHRYMESLGINMEVLSHWRKLSSTLRKLKSKLIEPNCYSSSSGRSDFNAPHGTYLSSSNGSRRGRKLMPLNFMYDYDDVLPVYKRSSKFRGPIKCILLVIDCNASDDFQVLQRSVSQFRKDLYMTCVKVVWLDRIDTRRAHFDGLQDESLPPTDHIMLEPLHGSRLSSVVRLLPEFGGDLVRHSTNYRRSNTFNNTRSETVGEIMGSSSGEIKPIKMKRNLSLASGNVSSYEQEVHKVLRSTSSDKVLSRTILTKSTKQTKNSSLEGKKVLVVEDHLIQRQLIEACITRLGAEHRTCTNGKEALEVVCEGLNNLSREEPSQFPYDFILMDCQMPVMDGFEAAKRIRDEEENYGIHIPIIALTAHEVDGDEGKKIFEAGMDLHLTKPLKQDVLLELMNYLQI